MRGREGEGEREREKERERGREDRIDVRTRERTYACDTRGYNTGMSPGCGERWCTITGRPEMIYVGRAGAICIASVFTGRDEATPAG